MPSTDRKVSFEDAFGDQGDDDFIPQENPVTHTSSEVSEEVGGPSMVSNRVPPEVAAKIRASRAEHKKALAAKEIEITAALAEIQRLRDLSIVGVGPNPVAPLLPALPSSSVTRLVSDDELDRLFGEGVDASQLFHSYAELEFPSDEPKSKFYERVVVADLCRGMILVPLRFAVPPIGSSAGTTVSFSNLLSPQSFYVVTAVHSDRSSDLVLLCSSLVSVEESAAFGPHLDNKTVLVLSASAIDSNRIPEVGRAALSKLHIVPIAPSSSIRSASGLKSLSSSVTGTTVGEVSRGAEVREAQAAPFKRAIHNDMGLFRTLTGPLMDISSGIFLSNIRNNNVKAGLFKLPIMNADHYLFFLQFRWTAEPYLASAASTKKLDSCHLSLLMPLTASGNFHVFSSWLDITTAIRNLRDLCICVFNENPKVAPFYSIIFSNIFMALEDTTPKDSLHDLPTSFLVWKVSSLFVEWSRLFSDARYMNVSFEVFKALNLEVLEVDAGAWQEENGRFCKRYTPQQLSVSDASGKGNGSGSANTAAEGSKKKRKSPSKVSSDNNAASKKSRPADVKGKSPSGKYICLNDFLSKQDSVRFTKCKKGDQCNLKHIPKPAAGAFSDSDKAELITTCTKTRGKDAPELIRFIQSIA